MTTPEKTELGLIALTGGVIWIIAPALPPALSPGQWLLFISLLVFFQSLLRDLWRLAAARRLSAHSPKTYAPCMCLETTLGLTVLLPSVVLIFSGIGQPVEMPCWSWTALALLGMITSFLIKDLVLEWNPWRIRRDQDHINVIVQWRRPKKL